MCMYVCEEGPRIYAYSTYVASSKASLYVYDAPHVLLR